MDPGNQGKTTEMRVDTNNSSLLDWDEIVGATRLHARDRR